MSKMPTDYHVVELTVNYPQKSIDPDRAHELRVACFDLQQGCTHNAADTENPVHLIIELTEGFQKITFKLFPHGQDTAAKPLKSVTVSTAEMGGPDNLSTYIEICKKFFNILKNGTEAQKKNLDMGRRGQHNAGAKHIQAFLDVQGIGAIAENFDQARHLFTLCAVCYSFNEQASPAEDRPEAGDRLIPPHLTPGF